jgi:hypothetical protein
VFWSVEQGAKLVYEFESVPGGQKYTVILVSTKMAQDPLVLLITTVLPQCPRHNARSSSWTSTQRPSCIQFSDTLTRSCCSQDHAKYSIMSRVAARAALFCKQKDIERPKLAIVHTTLAPGFVRRSQTGQSLNLPTSASESCLFVGPNSTAPS